VNHRIAPPAESAEPRAPRKGDEERSQRRDQVRSMRDRGMKRDDIAAALGCSVGTVDLEIKAIKGDDRVDRLLRPNEPDVPPATDTSGTENVPEEAHSPMANAAQVPNVISKLGTPKALDERLRAAASDFDRSSTRLVDAITAAKDDQIHADLGFASWLDYLGDVVQTNMPHVARSVEERRSLVALLSTPPDGSEGISDRVIAGVIGVSNATISRDQEAINDKQVLHDVTPEATLPPPEAPAAQPAAKRKGRDGKSHPAAQPRRDVPRPQPKPKPDVPQPQPRPDMEGVSGRWTWIPAEEEEAGRVCKMNAQSGSKRLRELKSGIGKSTIPELARLQREIGQLCVVLESYDVEDYDLSDEPVVWCATDIYDDLIMLGEWLDQTLTSIQRHLSDQQVRDKIGKLRDTTGRTPEEAETALRLAAQIERKLENRLG
jgi:hypothetical protein